MKQQLSELLSKADDIQVTAVMGDQEACLFASEIKKYLEDNGYIVEGVNQAIYAKPIFGQNIIKSKEIPNKVELIIGSQDRM